MNYKYICLSFIIGILCKIYDDINDNDLYRSLNIYNKPYFDEILKGLFVIGYTILCINFPFFLIMFTILNFILYIICKHDFGPYEFSSFISPIILIPFLKFNNSEIKKNIYWLFTIIPTLIFMESSSNKQDNTEYSYKKLYLRMSIVLTCIIILISKSYMYKNLFTSDVLIVMYFGIGYLTTSCVTQYLLLNNFLNSKLNVNNNDDDDTNNKDNK